LVKETIPSKLNVSADLLPKQQSQFVGIGNISLCRTLHFPGDILFVVPGIGLLILSWLHRVLPPDTDAVFAEDRRIQWDLAPISESISSLDQRERDLAAPVLGLLIKLKGKLKSIRQTEFEFLDEKMVWKTTTRKSAVVVQVQIEGVRW